MKWLTGVLFGILYLSITIFGLGPVLLADGSHEERMWTLAIVILLYVLVTAALIYWLRKKNWLS